MARSFNGTSDKLVVAAAPATASPLTIAAWIRATALAASTVACIGDTAGAAQDFFELAVSAAGLVSAVRTATGIVGTTPATAPLVVGAWSHACARFMGGTGVGANSAFLNGRSKGISSTSNTPASLDTMAIGVRQTSTATQFFPGAIAEVCIWRAALTDGEVLMLAEGVWPPSIRPGLVVGFWPLGAGRPERDVSRYQNHMTVTGSVPVVFPAPPWRQDAVWQVPGVFLPYRGSLGGTTLQTLSVVEASVLTLSRLASFARTLALVEASVLTLTALSTRFLTLTRAVVTAPVLTTRSTRLLTLARAAVSVPLLTTLSTFARTLSVASVTAPTLTRLATFLRTLSVAEASVPALTRLATLFRTMTVAEVSVPVLARAATFLRTLSVVEVAVPVLTRGLVKLQTLALATVSVVTLARAAIFARTLSVAEASVPALTKAVSLLRTLAVTGVTVPTLTRLASLFRTLTVAEVTVPALSRASIFLRILTRPVVSVLTLSTVLQVGGLLTQALTVAAVSVVSLSGGRTLGAGVAAALRSLVAALTVSPKDAVRTVAFLSVRQADAPLDPVRIIRYLSGRQTVLRLA